jgi:D-beta-D-heptose 7-phosphate kinase/D-beta-D-heptose 1-phosphate adenosyltransferase
MDRLTYTRLDDLLLRARDTHVLVVGDVMLDVYLRGNASRISPEAPVPVVKVAEEWRALGGAANVAANAVALGARCTVVGCVGIDAAGRELRQELEETGVDASGLVEIASRPTTIKTRVMARHQQVARYDIEAEHDVDDDVADLLGQRLAELVVHADVIVLQDYNKGVLVPALIATALRLGRQAGKPVVVDPKFRSFFAYRGATVFKPNITELSSALRDHVRPDDSSWLARIREELGCQHLLVTLGEDGMALCTADGEYTRVPAVARSVYDVSGAGDTVVAAFAVALAAGATVTEAAILANHAAGIEVSKAGVATVSPEELREIVREHHERAIAINARRE